MLSLHLPVMLKALRVFQLLMQTSHDGWMIVCVLEPLLLVEEHPFTVVIYDTLPVHFGRTLHESAIDQLPISSWARVQPYDLV